MNKIERNKLMPFLYQNKDATNIFNYDIIQDSLLEDGKSIISEPREGEEILDFISRNIDVIDFKKLVLYGEFASKILRKYSSRLEDKYHLIPPKEIHEKFDKLARENIHENEDINVFMFFRNKKIELYPINSKQELYDKESYPIKLRIEPSLIDNLIGVIQLDNIKFIFNDESFADLIYDTLSYNTLKDIGYLDEDISRDLDKFHGNIEVKRTDEFLTNYISEKEKVFSTAGILSKINEDNLYITSAYQYIGKLKSDVLMYHKNDKKENQSIELLKIEELKMIAYILKQVEKSVNFNKVTVSIKNPKDGEIKDLSLKDYIADYTRVLNEYAKILISENNKNLFNMDVLQFLDKETALKLSAGIKPSFKKEYYFLLYQSGCLSFQESLNKIKEIGLTESDEEFLRVRAISKCLTGKNNTMAEMMEELGLINSSKNVEESQKEDSDNLNTEEELEGNGLLNKIENPDIMFSKLVSDPELYELLDDHLQTIFFHYSLLHYLENGKYSDIAEKNIKYFIAKNDLAVTDLYILYSNYDMNLEQIEKLVGEENIKKSFAAEVLFTIVNDIKNFNEKGIKTEEDKTNYDLKIKSYEYLKQVYQKYGFLQDGKTEDKILDIFDDLVFDEDIFRQLYLDGFISGNTLYGYNNVLAEKLYNEGLLRNDDKRNFILKSGIDISIGDIIRLNQENILSNKDVFDFYMQNKISLDDLVTYGEDADIGQELQDEELIKLAKKYGIVKKDDVKSSFNKYLDAYLAFKKPDLDIQDKLFKAIGGKNARKEDVLELYSKGALGIETINPSDDLILLMIKQGKLKSGDEELLFKDTNLQGTKYLRLMSILRKLDNDDEKLNLLAGVYKTEDEVSSRRLNLLANELSYAFNEESGITFDNEILEEESTNKDKAKENNQTKRKTTVIRSLAKMFDAFKSIKPDYEHIILSGTYVVFLDDSALVEEVFRKSADGKSFITNHATYIISDEFFKYFLKDTYNKDFRQNLHDFFIDINREGKPYFRWSLVTAARRKNIAGIDRVVHGKSWSDRLQAKVTKKSHVNEEDLNEVLDDISKTSVQHDLEEI